MIFEYFSTDRFETFLGPQFTLKITRKDLLKMIILILLFLTQTYFDNFDNFDISKFLKFLKFLKA